MRGLRERTVTSPFLGEMPKEALEVTDRTGLSIGDDRSEYRERFVDESNRLEELFLQRAGYLPSRIPGISGQDFGAPARASRWFNGRFPPW